LKPGLLRVKKPRRRRRRKSGVARRAEPGEERIPSVLHTGSCVRLWRLCRKEKPRVRVFGIQT
jgi:hypothetical protein